jgi:cellulose synthase/poly-beta-1,6-N-acetylglucosamine synthase-like glycosyltransferase
VSAASRHALGTRLDVIEYERNLGKIAVLNDQVLRIASPIVALSDTSAMIPKHSLRAAVEHFRDPNVGFVAASYRLAQPGSEGERVYMAQLSKIRSDEAALGAPLGAHGALYFFRRSLFVPFALDTINDDFMLPMLITAQGYRGCYDTTIEAVELETTRRRQEFKRRVRIGAGNMQQTLRLFPTISSQRPWIAFMFVSGKGARPFMPILALIVGIATAILAARGFMTYGLLLALQICALLCGLAAILRRSPFTPKPIAWLGYLIEGYAASLLGVAHYILGLHVSGWQRAQGDRQAAKRIVRWSSTKA